MKTDPSHEKAVIREELRALGLRATAPRVAVLYLLRSVDRPLSHAEAVAQVNSDDWDRATIFRNLVKLVESGLVRTAGHLGGIARYEAVRDSDSDHAHAHFSCRACGHVSCLDEAVLPQSNKSEWDESIRQADVQVVGVCPPCLRLNNS